MIEQVIKNRMALFGITQAQLADKCGSTPTQMGLFLKGNAFLSQKSLESAMEYVGLDTGIYQRRLILAQKAADKLKGRKSEEILKMNKRQMIEATGLEAIECLIDVNAKQFDKIIEYGVVDCESTFPFFKTLVLHLLELNGKSTRKSIEMSWDKLAALAALSSGIPLLSSTALLGATIGALVGLSKYTRTVMSAATPLVAFTKKFFNN